MILRIVNRLVDHASGLGLRIAEWMTLFSFHVIHTGGKVASPVKRLRKRPSGGATPLDLEEEIEDFLFGEPESQELPN